MDRFVANRGTCIGVDRDIDRDPAKKLAISVKNLDATVSPVSYIDISLRINRCCVAYRIDPAYPRVQPTT